ncbi:hypothetical protein QVD99_008552 [Batrachochytrium dendrobatidis]|nr:hypothetical protein O5D80_007421 [Batrachochytrium dendrobatidis]KAK5665018.1 hypothetical protein QVD99_008552 [Batrachochytrium dendrobatidis]
MPVSSSIAEKHHYTPAYSTTSNQLSSSLLLLLIVLVASSVPVSASVSLPLTNTSYPDRGAAFGSLIGPTGLVGILIPVNAIDSKHSRSGCKPISFESVPPLTQAQLSFNLHSSAHWIALVERGECSFADKVRAMQQSGASAVIIGDNSFFGDLITMYSQGNVSDIVVPSVFISKPSYLAILELIGTTDSKDPNDDKDAHVFKENNANLNAQQPVLLNTLGDAPDIKDSSLLLSDLSTNPKKSNLAHFLTRTSSQYNGFDSIPIQNVCTYFQFPCVSAFLLPDEVSISIMDIIIVTIMSALCPIVIMFFIYSIWLLLQFNMRQKSTISVLDLSRLPIKVYFNSKRHENDPTTCAICLEDFVDEDTLRTLVTCRHEFHASCIDPWLRYYSKLCPTCKQEILLNENTPLLARTQQPGLLANLRNGASTLAETTSSLAYISDSFDYA